MDGVHRVAFLFLFLFHSWSSCQNYSFKRQQDRIIGGFLSDFWICGLDTGKKFTETCIHSSSLPAFPGVGVWKVCSQEFISKVHLHTTLVFDFHLVLHKPHHKMLQSLGSRCQGFCEQSSPVACGLFTGLPFFHRRIGGCAPFQRLGRVVPSQFMSSSVVP